VRGRMTPDRTREDDEEGIQERRRERREVKEKD
jgi:hypothetical protein